MTKAQERAVRDFKTNAGSDNRHAPQLHWRVRGYFEVAYYWINAFSFPVTLIIWFVTGDYWKALGYLFVSQLYNISQNMRGLFLHIEQYIEYQIDKTI